MAAQFNDNITLTPSAPFMFQRPYKPFNWQSLVGMDVERVLQENDIVGFDPILDSLIYGDMHSELAGNVPSWAVKVYQLQQYLAQYLIYTQEQLRLYIAQLLERPDYADELARARARINQLERELQLERQKRQSDNMLLRLASVKPELLETLPRCLECGKAFGDYKFLVNHYHKRHPGCRIPPPPLPNLVPPQQPCQCCCHVVVQSPPKPPPRSPTPEPPPSKDPSTKVESDIFLDDHAIDDFIPTKTQERPEHLPSPSVISEGTEFRPNYYHPFGDPTITSGFQHPQQDIENELRRVTQQLM